MKRNVLLFLSLLPALAGCGPQLFTMRLEMRRPSASGLELDGKSLAVAYVDGGSPLDSAFGQHFCLQLAESLEKDYAGGAQAVRLYRIPATGNERYSTRDSLQRLVMDLDADVVFVSARPQVHSCTASVRTPVTGAASPDSAYTAEAALRMSYRVYIYDSMNAADKPLFFTGDRQASAKIWLRGDEKVEALAARATSAATLIAGPAASRVHALLAPTWKEEAFPIYYYDVYGGHWEEASRHAEACRWKEAVQEWLQCLDTRNLERRSCAAYNLATACFLMGDARLALEWLDRSDKDLKLPTSGKLRARIEERLKR